MLILWKDCNRGLFNLLAAPTSLIDLHQCVLIDCTVSSPLAEIASQKVGHKCEPRCSGFKTHTKEYFSTEWKREACIVIDVAAWKVILNGDLMYFWAKNKLQGRVRLCQWRGMNRQHFGFGPLFKTFLQQFVYAQDFSIRSVSYVSSYVLFQVAVRVLYSMATGPSAQLTHVGQVAKPRDSHFPTPYISKPFQSMTSPSNVVILPISITFSGSSFPVLTSLCMIKLPLMSL